MRDSGIHLKKISENGEISWDIDRELYIVFDETWSDTIIETPDLALAQKALEEYCEYLLTPNSNYYEDRKHYDIWGNSIFP